MPAQQGLSVAPSKKHCLLCATELDGPALAFGSMPISNDYSAGPGDRYQSISMTACPRCGHVQLDSYPLPAVTMPRVPWLRYNEPGSHLKVVAERVLAQLTLPQERRLEAGGIGPFDGPLLEQMEQLGVSTTLVDLMSGVEALPGRSYYLESIQERIAHDPVLARLQVQNHDVVVCRYLLEHCHRPCEGLEALAKAVRPGGLLVIEVPDSTKFLLRKDYSFVWEEHVSYFTEATLRAMLARGGLVVEDLLRFEGALEDALVAICRVPELRQPHECASSPTDTKALFESYRQAFPVYKDVWRSSINALAGTGRVVVMGAGHQAIFWVNALQLNDRVAYFVDDDPNKQGLIPPGMSVPIVSSEAMAADEEVSLCLLALSPGVHDSLRERFKGLLDRGARIMSLFPGAGDAPIEWEPPGLTRQSAEVFLAPGSVNQITPAHIAFLKRAAVDAPRHRARINLHGNSADSLHQMIIAIRSNSYIRPHKHLGKCESFHIVSGSMDVVVFTEEGDVSHVISLSADAQGDARIYRMSDSLFHTLIIHSDIVVLHEITNGPFVLNGAIFAPFSPPEGDEAAIAIFTAELRRRVDEFKKGNS